MDNFVIMLLICNLQFFISRIDRELTMRIPNIGNRPWKNLDIIIIGFAKILDGLVAILSIGYYLPPCHIKYVTWRFKKSLQYKIEEEQRNV